MQTTKKHFIMRNIKRIFLLILVAFACHATSVAQKGTQKTYEWRVYKSKNKKITINGVSSFRYQEDKKKTFSLKDVIVWPKSGLYMEIIPTISIRIGNVPYKKGVRYKICNNNALIDDLNKHNLLWWIKFNQTSAMATGHFISYERYEDYMINDIISILPKTFGIKTTNDKHFFFKFVIDGEIIHVQANTNIEDGSIYFTKQQLEDAHYDFRYPLPLCLSYGYNNYDVDLVNNFIINMGD